MLNHKQRGFAGIIMLAIFGIVMVLMVTGAMRYIQSSQEAGTTVHAVTQAQVRAWTGVEAMRQFFYQSGPTQLATLNVGDVIDFPSAAGVTGQVVAISTTAASCVDGVQLTVNIFGTAAQTSSGVQSIFCVAAGTTLTTYNLDDAVLIKGGLTLGGDINVLNGNNSNTSFYVEGDVSGHGSISGFSLLYSTGNLTLGGHQNIATVAAEGDVTLTGSGAYTNVTAMGNISMSGGVNSLSAKANGNITLNSSADVHGTLAALGDVFMDSSTSAGSVLSQGNVSATNASIGNLMAEGNFTESSAGSVGSGQVGGSISRANWNNSVNVTHVEGLQVAISPVTPVNVQDLRIDAWALKSAANLAFDIDLNGNILVQVRNMSGIANGNYYLAGKGKNQDYLCDTPSYASGSCYKKICVGYSDSNSCFKYVSKDDEWQLDGSQFVPAVLWFNGSVNVGTGRYVDTIIATKDISTSGSHTIMSLNFAGYNDVCATSNFGSFHATDLCSAGELHYSPIANIALLAGGYVEDTFYGGDIHLGASSEVFGSVMAGNLLYSGGNTTIHGYLSVANQSGGTDGSDFRGSTTIDLSNLPTSYRPGEVITGNVEQGEGNTGNTGKTKVSQLWSRYL
ncbi:hypothetical protein JYB87_10345 [Shewanella avicenniae]|uniref:Uncharacterized protein n=1 Tax=Shewanella avicenniae TaxID=2814294 RepID=A0ABX7QMD3_9GAMM|nr:hypothetical protein [Shewanella avicenniae]QSX32182.1 hypothetical protein JYB87_10345 [Shewanella avicenniae]